LGLVASRVDPASEKVKPAETFVSEIERYLERKRSSMKPRSFDAISRHLRDHAKPLHSLRLAEIDRRSVAVLLGDIETHCGPVARNRVRSTLSAMFAWGIREGLADVNPVSGTGKASEGGSRDRVLSEAELATILRALNDPTLWPFNDITRLLVLTAARRT